MKAFAPVAVAWTAALGLFMGVLDNTIVNVALARIASDLHVSVGAAQWVITIYFLAQAAVIPVAGYLGDRFGARRVFLSFLGLFTAASVLCGISPSLGMLLAARTLQGLGGGALFPLGMAIALRAFPQGERDTASAILGFSALVAPVVGPTIGGFLTDRLGWSSIFLVNLPVGVVALALGQRVFPRDEAASGARGSFDVVGLVLSAAGTLLVLYGLSAASDGWWRPSVLALLAAGVAVLAVFAVYELRVSKDPVLDLRLLGDRGFLVAVAVVCLVALTVFASIFILPLFLITAHQPAMTGTSVGLVMGAQGIASAVAVLLSGRILYRRLGVRRLIALGGVLLVAGTWKLAMLEPDVAPASLLPWLVTRGLGFGFAFVPAITRALEEISGPAMARASSLLNVLRQVASALGTALVGTLFASETKRLAPLVGAAVAGTAATNRIFLLVTIGSALVVVLARGLHDATRGPVAPAAAAELS